MTLRYLVPVLIFSSFGLTACGSDDDGGDSSQKATVNEATAKSMAASTVNAIDAASTDNGLTINSNIQSAASSAQGLIQPAAGGQPQGEDVLGHVAEALAAGDCACDDAGKKCVFDKCGSGGVEISGELSWSAGSMKCVDLTYVITTGATGGTNNTTIKTNCDLSFTASEINGTLSSNLNGASEAGGYKTSYVTSSTVTFNKLTYASGAATGGSLSVKGSYDVTVNGKGAKYSGSGTVNFP